MTHMACLTFGTFLGVPLGMGVGGWGWGEGVRVRVCVCGWGGGGGEDWAGTPPPDGRRMVRGWQVPVWGRCLAGWGAEAEQDK